MQSRHAVFAVLRRLALRDLIQEFPRTPRWSGVAARPFHHSSVHSSEQQPKQSLPQLSTLEVHTSSTLQRSKKFVEPTRPVPSDKQAYEMTFTCKPCGTRSTHKLSKQGYHFGSVLITCPECKNRHIISDHLGIFTDKAVTIEDLMREKGQLVKKGTLSEDGNLEFWEDGTSTSRPVNSDPKKRSL